MSIQSFFKKSQRCCIFKKGDSKCTIYLPKNQSTANLIRLATVYPSWPYQYLAIYIWQIRSHF